MCAELNGDPVGPDYACNSRDICDSQYGGIRTCGKTAGALGPYYDNRPTNPGYFLVRTKSNKNKCVDDAGV